MKLRNATDIELVAELVRRNGMVAAPTQTTYFVPHVEVLVGLGRNHTARITMDVEAVGMVTDNLSAPKESVL